MHQPIIFPQKTKVADDKERNDYNGDDCHIEPLFPISGAFVVKPHELCLFLNNIAGPALDFLVNLP